MGATPLPSFDPGFSTAEMTAVFSPEAWVAGLLRFEAALAEAEAAAGIVPGGAAAEIVAACRVQPQDPGWILAGTWDEGTPLIRLLAELRSRLSEEAAGWLHHGATSQDALDTGLMLQCREGLGVLGHGLEGVASRLRELAVVHRDTVMAGRTFLQHAEPITFGLLAAQWLEPALRQLSELRSLAGRLPVQLGGPAGSLGALGAPATAVMEGIAARLGLGTPALAWHADRSRVAESVGLVGRVAGSMAKIASDLALLAQTEIAEVTMRAGGSSSMPHKRNPIDSVRALAAAAICRTLTGAVDPGRGQELGRGLGGWHAEWLAVPLVFQSGAAAVQAVESALASLQVNAERMRANLGTESGHGPGLTVGVLIDRVLSLYDQAAGGR